MNSKHDIQVRQVKKVIVVGNGMVGYKFCEKLVDKGGLGDIQLTVFGAEPRPAYDRVHLSAYFTGQDAQALEMCASNWYHDNGIELIVGDAVVDINTTDKTVRSHSGRRT